MNKLILSLVLLLAVNLIFAQVPRGIKYQAVIRDSNGEVLSEQNIALKISILQSSPSGSTVYAEEHAAQTNTHGLVNITIGEGTIVSGDFSGIPWEAGPFFVKMEMDPEGGTSYTEMGTSQLLSVPYALYSGQTGEVAQYDSDTLFVVKDNEGNVVFAVFPDGAKVYVNEDNPKGPIGGFAVSGRNNTKGEYEVMRVTPDSTRIFVNQQAKGPIGGFAVSGRNNTKQSKGEFEVMRVTPDGTIIYVNDTSMQKGPIGGFAVSGRNNSKTELSRLMSLTRDNYFIGHEAGKSNTTGLYNSFMGYNAGVNNTEGSQNTLLGYKSGYSNINGYKNIMIGDSSGFSNTEGIVNVFIGSKSGMENIDGHSNTFLGYASGTNNTTGYRNTYVGTYAGHFHETGSYNTSLGSSAGSELRDGGLNTFVGAFSALWTMKGQSNTFLGTYSGALADTLNDCIFIGTSAGGNCKNALNNIFIGNSAGGNSSDNSNNIFIGYRSGYESSAEDNIFIGPYTGYSNTTGIQNVYIGKSSGYNNSSGIRNLFLGSESGYNNVDGDSSIFIGFKAGYHELESSKLYIENSAADKTSALIYGEFDNDILGFNAFVGIGTISPSEKLEVVDGNIRVTNGNFIDDGIVLNVPDYVFDKDYRLESIEEHAAFMWKNKHLPALKSAKELKNSGGYDISERREQILEELEKAHIYIEQLNKQVKKLKEVNNLLINRLDKLEKK